MPVQDPAELVVGKSGDVWLAPVGTTLPATSSATLNSAFVRPGYLAEDGVSFTVGGEVTDFNVWQSLQPARREKTGQELAVAFSMVQWNEVSVPLAFGGGSVTDLGGGEFGYDFPSAGTAIDERALVLDVLDGVEKFRYVFYRGNVNESVETTFQRGSLAALPVTFSVLAPSGGGKPGYLRSNMPGFAVGS